MKDNTTATRKPHRAVVTHIIRVINTTPQHTDQDKEWKEFEAQIRRRLTKSKNK